MVSAKQRSLTWKTLMKCTAARVETEFPTREHTEADLETGGFHTWQPRKAAEGHCSGQQHRAGGLAQRAVQEHPRGGRCPLLEGSTGRWAAAEQRHLPSRQPEAGVVSTRPC